MLYYIHTCISVSATLFLNKFKIIDYSVLKVTRIVIMKIGILFSMLQWSLRMEKLVNFIIKWRNTPILTYFLRIDFLLIYHCCILYV